LITVESFDPSTLRLRSGHRSASGNDAQSALATAITNANGKSRTLSVYRMSDGMKVSPKIN